MLYRLALFTHVVAALGIYAGLALDWLAVARLRTVTTGASARPWVGVLEVSAAIGPWARMLSLAAGLYLAIMAWSWEGWIIVGLAAWLLLVLLGEPLTGRELRQLRADAVGQPGELSGEARGRFQSPRLWRAVLVRPGLGLGIVFLMTVKPPAIAAVITVAIGALLGLAAMRWTRPPRPATQARLQP
jgi:hypothetical protein